METNVVVDFQNFTSRDMFDKWQAQRWWAENYDRIMELYNVQRFNRQALNTPARSEDEVLDFTLHSNNQNARCPFIECTNSANTDLFWYF